MIKKTFAAALPFACASTLSAQGLFDIAPNDEAVESSPIKYSAGVSVGYDTGTQRDDVDTDQETAYVGAYIGANMVAIDDRHTLEFYTNLAMQYNADASEASGINDTNFNLSLGAIWTVRINERLRVTTTNHVGYQLEPDYNYGFASQRTSDEYWYWRSDTNVGYRWSRRFATYTGVIFSGTHYPTSGSGSNRLEMGAYNQMRWQLDARTVLTGGYRFRNMNNNGRADSQSHFFTMGVERRVSPTTVFVARVGGQFYDREDAGSEWTPNVELALRTSGGGVGRKIADRLTLRTFFRHEITDYDTGNGGQDFQVNNNFRYGLATTYAVSPSLSIYSGLNVSSSHFSEDKGGDSNKWAHAINANLGFTYALNPRVNFNGSYNYTTGLSDLAERDFDRHRFQLGMGMSF